MASYTNEIDSVGGGYGFGGGGLAMILVVLVVLWTLFRDGGHKDGYGAGYGSGCGPCVQPTFKDESNWEFESHMQKKLCELDRDVWKTDQDVWKTACETQQVEHCEAEKTRALIEANYIQDLRDTINEKNMALQTLKSEMFTEKKFDQVLGAIGKLDCECVKRPPVWAECRTPNAHDIDCREGFGRRGRGRCDFDFDGCCA